MKKVIIYPGRFQPMLSHHAEVYDRLKAEYPGVDVYFGTSNKVEENKSPFSFKEKQLIATAQGIDPNKVLLANRPYVWDDYAKYFDADQTHIFFAVGEKDMEDDPRFTFNNIDTKSGLDMKLRPNKDTGEVEPKYYQMINTYKDDPRPMSQRGYIVQAPNVMSSGEDVASASAFRKALIDSPDKESAREIFNKQYKEYNESVFDLIYKKIVGDKMNEDLNTLMKLAGLEVQEDAPVEFDTPLKPEEIKFSPVSKSSSVMSIANRFPSGQDVNDPEVKKEEFLKALMKSPSSILSEINERILPDENGLEVSKKLSEIIDSMRDKGFMDIDKDDRGFVLDVVKNALKNMELKAGDERDFDPETSSLESVELDDIRSDYGIEEGAGEYSYTLEYNGESNGYSIHKLTITSPEGETKEIADDFTYFDVEGDELQAELESWFHKGIGVADASVHEGKMKDIIMDLKDMSKEEFCSAYPQHADEYEDLCKQYDDDAQSEPQESFDAGAEQSREEEAYNELMDAYQKDGEEGLCKAIGCSHEELDREMTEWAMDHNLHMDDDRDEVIHGYIEDLVDNADWKDHGEYESIEEAMCGCCGNNPCNCSKDCDGCRKDESIEDTSVKALDAAMAELRTLAGI
ncbi:hypothetical protein N9N08_00920 [bacterium]|nr:hypothetical protein [bacterium]